MSFRIIAESVLIRYCQNPLQSLSRTPRVTGGDLMFKEDSSKPYRCFFNEDNYNNYTEGAHLAKGRLMRSLYTAKMSNNSNKVINNERKLSLVN